MQNVSGAILAALILTVSFIQGCAQPNAVTLYTSVDRDYAEPVIQVFMDRNPDIQVNIVYDADATQATGLYNRILHERNNPQADVFWNNEILRTVQLKHQGLLESYHSPSAHDIPSKYKDPEGYWTGFSLRARVMVVNNTLLPPDHETPTEIPTTFGRLNSDRFVTGMAIPENDSSLTHMAVLYAHQGNLLRPRLALAKNSGMRFLANNATVRDEVANGTLAYGLTDSADGFVAMEEGKPVRMIYLDQSGNGTIAIPKTVSLIKNSPNPANGQKLIDYLLSPEVEQMLADSRARRIPVRSNVPRPEIVPDLDSIKVMETDFEQAAQVVEQMLEELRELY